jgi:hypothetical protein
MPYIIKDRREKLDKFIDGLQSELQCDGEVNYTITKIIQKYYFDGVGSYKILNSAIGVLECVKQEFYRRIIVPYEERKIKENGDVY